MTTKNYHLKGMLCSRCLKVLRNELTAIGVEVVDLKLGFVQLKFDSKKIKLSEVEKVFANNDFEIIRNNDKILAEQTKNWIIKYVWQDEQEKSLPTFLRENIGKSYQLLSRNFSKIFGKTIERYSLKLRVELVKESINSGDENFCQIAYSLGYHNPSALSRQFKKETGITMMTYKQLGRNDRIRLDKIL